MAKGSKREGGGIGELLAYAGDRKFLTYLGMALSALSQLLSFGPYVCIWLVARDLIAVAPNWSEACDIATYGWWAVGFALASIVAYFVGLMCTHLSAFRSYDPIRCQEPQWPRRPLAIGRRGLPLNPSRSAPGMSSTPSAQSHIRGYRSGGPQSSPSAGFP